MEKKVLIDQFQKVTEEDFNNFGRFPQEALDHVVADTIIPDMAFTGFAVVQSGPAEITVGNGRLYVNGRVHFNDTDGGLEIDLLTSLPAVTRRIVAITTWPATVDSEVEPRTFLTDVVTRQQIARGKATEEWRWANISTINGVEGPDPSRPTIPADVLVVAWVVLDTAGIVSITPETINRAPSVRNNSQRLDENDSWRLRAGTRLDTLGSDIFAINNRIAGLPSPQFTHNLARDLADVKEVIGLPDVRTAWSADHFLDDDESDTAHADFLAKVEEGIRFADAQMASDQLGLLNPLDDRVMSAGNFIVPAYDAVTRISNVGNDGGELSISQYQYQTVTTVQRTRTRIRVRWGQAQTVCTNSAMWVQGRYDPITGIFTRGGETWQVVDPETEDPWRGPIAWHWVRMRQYFEDRVDEPYWENIVTTQGVNGSMIGETWLNSQGGYLVEVGLYFTRKGATGDVHVMIVEASASGAPDYTRVIARTTLPVANIALWPNRTPVAFSPTLLVPGRRYAVVPVTAGNHFVATTANNKFLGGSLFFSTDGAWSQGDLLRDMAMDIKFARFRSPRVEVQLNPLQLPGGIVGIDINADASLPDGTQLIFEVQQNGVWIPMQPDYALTGLPPLLPFRAVFVGSQDIMPGLGVMSNSRVLTSRPRSDFRHVSETRTMPSPVNTVHVDVRIEAWRGVGFHTADVNLRTGGGTFDTIVQHSAMTEEVAPDDPTGAILRRYTFSGLGGLTAYKIEILGTTTNVVTPFHVARRTDIALA